MNELDVAIHTFEPVHGHAMFDGALDGRGLLLGKVAPGLGTEQDKNLLERAFGLGRGDSGGLAIRSGQVSVVPEPTTMLLFGVGLLGIAGIGRRRNQ